ncbi:hypothetical protein WJX73_003838 [Symbiochloris irregularis]|uniref:Uncharacterized protein n=1 Tax=Symbiochloris irregularis TaxID=706552 RepID=A0AAW1NLD0_9CHLO
MLLTVSASPARPAGPGPSGRAELRSSFCAPRTPVARQPARQQRHARRQTTTCALPVIGLFVNPFTITTAWVAGAYKFYTGYERTPFENSDSKKATLTALWPILFATSADFRKHFSKAISSSDQ